jgi:hypothetical protein
MKRTLHILALCWMSSVALVPSLCLAQTAAQTPAQPSALAAIDLFLASSSEGRKETIYGVVGFFGQPAPPQWLILTDAGSNARSLRESVVTQAGVVAERKFRRQPKQDLPDIPMPRAALKIDSGAAFRLAEAEARQQKMAFESAHYQLRCREAGLEPVWMLNLLNANHVSIGVVYVSAVTGKVLRTSWPGKPTSPARTGAPASAPANPPTNGPVTAPSTTPAGPPAGITEAPTQPVPPRAPARPAPDYGIPDPPSSTTSTTAPPAITVPPILPSPPPLSASADL